MLSVPVAALWPYEGSYNQLCCWRHSLKSFWRIQLYFLCKSPAPSDCVVLSQWIFLHFVYRSSASTYTLPFNRLSILLETASSSRSISSAPLFNTVLLSSTRQSSLSLSLSLSLIHLQEDEAEEENSYFSWSRELEKLGNNCEALRTERRWKFSIPWTSVIDRLLNGQ